MGVRVSRAVFTLSPRGPGVGGNTGVYCSEVTPTGLLVSQEPPKGLQPHWCFLSNDRSSTGVGVFASVIECLIFVDF